ncbi:MAG TPA: glutamyl-tRNA reductase [Dehalococcoidia bacterium]|nr:glutamyl-tRNA reductase [Dehalococcoidia bacterium]
MPSATVDLVLLGANHVSAPVEVRERLAASAADLHAALDGDRGSVEWVSLVTCNRVELYLAGAGAASVARRLEDDIGARCAEAFSNGSARLYRYRGAEVARHLFRVASSLDSLVLGESDVLGQVGAALAMARERGTAGPLLTTLFQWAVRAGRRVRSETGLGRVDTSVSVAAVELAATAVPDLARARVVIVGTGKMGEVAVRALERRRVADVRVVGRTPERVACLAGPGRRAMLMHELATALATADVVISATSAPHPVITPAALGARPEGRPLVIIDIAVPRDVDPAVRTLPGVRVYDIDDLAPVARRYRTDREAEVQRAEGIVEEEARRFSEWLRQREAVPAIAAVHRRAEAIRRAEVERAAAELGLGEEQRQVVEAMSAALVKRLLHDPFVRLKAPGGERYLLDFERLFSVSSRS